MEPTANFVPWRSFLNVTAKTLIAFYIATFSTAVYFIFHGMTWKAMSILVILLYLFVIFACGRLIIKKFSLPALMLLVPIAPLVVLIIVVTMLPILEKMMP